MSKQELTEPMATAGPLAACAGTDAVSDTPSDENITPLAKYRGQQITELPDDLFIPPEALRVFLEAFEGPLDLLLYLIRKNNLDIIDIPIADVTRQYMNYIHVMRQLQIELASDYLVMAAMLAEIKSRLLLPRQVIDDEDEDAEDPRAELIRRLQEYEQFKHAGETLFDMPRLGTHFFTGRAEAPDYDKSNVPQPEVSLPDLLLAMKNVLARAELTASHAVLKEPLSIRERMSEVLEQCGQGDYCDFSDCFTFEEGRTGVVVTFIAILELLKQGMIDMVQSDLFAPIYIKAKSA